MEWIMMNVITDALRKVRVASIQTITSNVDGRMFRMRVADDENRRKFLEFCVKSVPALNIPQSVFGSDKESTNIFRFRLVELDERKRLLDRYEQLMPSEVYQILISKPIYTFIDLSNPIVEAFTKVAVASTLYSFDDILRATSMHIMDQEPNHISKRLNLDSLVVGTASIIVNVARKVI